MRDHMAPTDSARNLLNFGHELPRSSLASDASAALDLVAEAADVIKNIERRATESEAFAKSLAESAIEKLRLADSRIQSAEEGRRAAEQSLVRLRTRLQETEKDLQQLKSSLASANAQVENAEQRMKSAEARATHAEKAMKEVEHAIRTQLVGRTRELSKGPDCGSRLRLGFPEWDEARCYSPKNSPFRSPTGSRIFLVTCCIFATAAGGNRACLMRPLSDIPPSLPRILAGQFILCRRRATLIVVG